MTRSGKQTDSGSAKKPPFRAVAYYRSSVQDRQEESISVQRQQVREWAEQHGVEIIEEFADAGQSEQPDARRGRVVQNAKLPSDGSSFIVSECSEQTVLDGRPAFHEMMDRWVTQRSDFEYVLCLDASRWGRFPDIDLSAQHSGRCQQHGKQVIYTGIGKPPEDDPLYSVYVQFERFRAAQYSSELSDKVRRGCAMIADQGEWAGDR
jgi:DNA invertase Pin-like site-specific DNA recombinase